MLTTYLVYFVTCRNSYLFIFIKSVKVDILGMLSGSSQFMARFELTI